MCYKRFKLNEFFRDEMVRIETNLVINGFWNHSVRVEMDRVVAGRFVIRFWLLIGLIFQVSWVLVEYIIELDRVLGSTSRVINGSSFNDRTKPTGSTVQVLTIRPSQRVQRFGLSIDNSNPNRYKYWSLSSFSNAFDLKCKYMSQIPLSYDSCTTCVLLISISWYCN